MAPPAGAPLPAHAKPFILRTGPIQRLTVLPSRSLRTSRTMLAARCTGPQRCVRTSVPTGAQAPRGPDVGLRLPASSLPLTSYPPSSFSTLPAGRVPQEVPQPGCVPRVPSLHGITTDRLCVKRTQRPLQLRAQWAQGPAVPPLSVLRTGRTAGTRQGQEPCSAGRETLSRAVVERVNVEATVGLHGGPQTGALAARLDCPAPRISVRGSLPGGAFPVLGVSPPWAMGSPPDKGRCPRG